MNNISLCKKSDLRELLVNDGDIGPVHDIAVSENEVGQINGIGFDLDCKLFRSDGPFPDLGKMSPEETFENIVRRWLENHPVLKKSEVRMSGGGLHVILRPKQPILLDTHWKLEHWSAKIKVIQACLPIDPDQPGVLMMTRPIDSVNSKNGKTVTQLQAPEAVTEEETDFFFRKDAGILMIRNDRVTSLQDGISLVQGAESVLANFFTCELTRTDKEGREGSRCFAPPRKLVELLFCSEPVLQSLPEIKLISQSPVYDQSFVLRGPGYHSEHGIYVLGDAIEPISFQFPGDVKTALDRLPPCHREWLSGFCFQSDADLVHCVAVLLTHLLIPHFIDPGKPAVIFDSNQPGLGKTLLVETMGILCDGIVPHFMVLTNNDEELQKQTLSQLRQERGRFLVFDNVKRSNGTAIVSQFLESLVTTSEVSIRILGKSEDYVCRNDRLIAITMNNTTASTDIVSRSLPIRLLYEGSPRERSFHHRDLKEFARRHRHVILGELYGMIEHWKQCGMPYRVDCHHRFHCWASIIGGILQSCGFPEFLANLDEADQEFDETRSGLEDVLDNVILTEGILPKSGMIFHVPAKPLAASEWWRHLEQCDIFKSELGQKNSPRSRRSKPCS